jgi:hypothetical protein
MNINTHVSDMSPAVRHEMNHRTQNCGWNGKIFSKIDFQCSMNCTTMGVDFVSRWGKIDRFNDGKRIY